MTSQLWSSVPWVESGDTWHKRRVPYIQDATYLHTLDVWQPKSAEESSFLTADSLQHKKGPWVIYIHGGAWRDPLVDSSSFEATALKLLSDKDTPIAGIASINYPLSSHPNHPTDPAPPRDPSQPVDVARQAKHPDHIIALLTAISFLQNDLRVAHEYILSGHSCGATMTFQTLMNPHRWSPAAGGISVPKVKKPSVVAPLNGLYDLATFINSPPESHQQLQSLYTDFTKNAFGNDEAVWKAVCPTSITDWNTEWPEGKVVVIAQSKEDGLVPYAQTELMKDHLSKTSTLKVIEMKASGDHNDLWKQADEIKDIIKCAIEHVSKV
ncbi:kynurenine formamidase [Fusarium beomiforme]|uniref:Kynurenine formamidase n=1 Tax=Fusarium beomiforme TaxID=44412 RepID=A0A9P5E4F7_9HYPO|nr:kynurenine formamidase [Fusarium beomiforme]